MRLQVLWGALLASLAGPLTPQFALSAPPQPYSAEVTRLGESPFFTVDVNLGEFGKIKMLIDTGATETVIADWIVREKGIPVVSEDTPGMPLEPKVLKARVSEMSVGKKKKSLHFLYIAPTPAVFEKMGIGGIFNPQRFFNNQDLLLDFPNKRILAGKLEKSMKQRDLKKKVAIEKCSNEIDSRYLFDLKVDGIHGRFYLNTGGARSTVRPGFASRLPSLGLRAQPVGEASSRLTKIPVLMSGLKSNLDLDVDEDSIGCPSADGRLGNDFFAKYGVFLSAHRDELRLYK